MRAPKRSITASKPEVIKIFMSHESAVNSDTVVVQHKPAEFNVGKESFSQTSIPLCCFVFDPPPRKWNIQSSLLMEESVSLFS